jgi:hypothetical protein
MAIAVADACVETDVGRAGSRILDSTNGGEKLTVNKIPAGFIIPSAAFTLKKNQVVYYQTIDRKPHVGDVVFARISRLGHHQTLENRSGRIHKINVGTRSLFVFGNRYAPDHYEGTVHDEPVSTVDLLARSGVVGRVRIKNSTLQDPTRVRILGYVVNSKGEVVNTLNHPAFSPRSNGHNPRKARSKLVLVVGTSMNCGKSVAAAACCWGLSAMGYEVRASKITGTASLKDILHMNDAGAAIYTDFTAFGYPSTYLCDETELLRIFNQTDLKYANNPKNYWVVELADGILQRETALLLANRDITSRIHRLIFCAADAVGCIGGIRVLEERFGLVPDGISGICSSSPLARRELEEFTSIPVFDNMARDLNQMSEILV